jgi:hypothetical protein
MSKVFLKKNGSPLTEWVVRQNLSAQAPTFQEKYQIISKRKKV